jgi:crossover junction endodeoxyribonuclease RuvC
MEVGQTSSSARFIKVIPAHRYDRFFSRNSPTKLWQQPCERRRLRAMKAASPAARSPARNGSFRVLGVDPASAGPTGYGIVESDGRRCRMLHYGALKVAPKRQKECLGAALQDVHELLCRLMDEFSPDALAVESVFTALNMRTALKLAEVRGVVLLAAAQRGVAVHSYSPREVKASVAGYGQADKRQMQLMVRALLEMDETPEPSDAADALAVALCHLQAEQTRQRFGLPANSAGEKLHPRSFAAKAAVGSGGATQDIHPRIVISR